VEKGIGSNSRLNSSNMNDNNVTNAMNSVAKIQKQRNIKYTLLALGTLALLVTAAIPAAYAFEAEFIAELSEDALMIAAGVAMVGALVLFWGAKKKANENAAQAALAAHFGGLLKERLADDLLVKKVAKYVWGPIQLMQSDTFNDKVIELINNKFLSNLRTLEISNGGALNSIERGIDALKNLKNLRSLTINGCGISNDQLRSIMDACPNLIDLRFMHVPALDFSGVCEAIGQRRMRALEFANCSRIADAIRDAETPFAGMNLSMLERFELSDGAIIDPAIDIQKFQFLTKCKLGVLGLDVNLDVGSFPNTLENIMPKQKGGLFAIQVGEIEDLTVETVMSKPNRNVSELWIRVNGDERNFNQQIFETLFSKFPRAATIHIQYNFELDGQVLDEFNHSRYEGTMDGNQTLTFKRKK
jgi:hypothetical protein